MPADPTRNPLYAANAVPSDDFEGLSPSQVHPLLRDFLGPGSVVKLREDPPGADADRVPLVRLTRHLLTALGAGEARLTAKGNLPVKLVRELYATGALPDDYIEEGIVKLRGEDDYLPAQVVKYLLTILGWTKKRHGRLSLTKKGHRATQLSGAELFGRLFRAHLQRFNLAYADGYPESGELQYLFPYFAYLLLILGRKPRSVGEYSDRMLRAFPMLDLTYGPLLPSVLERRLVNNFLALYALLPDAPPGINADVEELRPTELFYELFYLDRDARPEPPTEEQAYTNQLTAALFDAEMGSHTHLSDDMPPELLQQFQQQIRDFEQQRAAGKLVAVGDLLGDVALVPPEEITDDALARREARRLLGLLKKVGILTDDASQLEPRPYYTFLHDMLLAHEVVPPRAGQQLLLPLREVLRQHVDPVKSVTEYFVFHLLNLEEAFPIEVLNDRMRLNGRVVGPMEVMPHLQAWRARFRKITPIGFEFLEDSRLPERTETDAVQLFVVEYAVEYRDGGTDNFVGPGVVELVFDGTDWRVSGAHFAGFEL
ncbi:hypothetical protein [Lewinella sp. JB7]|uniref:hypothetical protein n=1 Tax=Lewinella sp. JB7 TaxID=2962887 RepID=UPI0020C99350|nr:hypothetical protein [Lewinella sp. JB7]MCP9234865.1 hypothetical protein [Lewinella sp. JB7]